MLVVGCPIGDNAHITLHETKHEKKHKKKHEKKAALHEKKHKRKAAAANSSAASTFFVIPSSKSDSQAQEEVKKNPHKSLAYHQVCNSFSSLLFVSGYEHKGVDCNKDSADEVKEGMAGFIDLLRVADDPLEH